MVSLRYFESQASVRSITQPQCPRTDKTSGAAYHWTRRAAGNGRAGTEARNFPKRGATGACSMSDGAIPPASREEVPTDLGGAAAAKPQTSGGGAGQTPGTPNGDKGERRHGFMGGE